MSHLPTHCVVAAADSHRLLLLIETLRVIDRIVGGDDGVSGGLVADRTVGASPMIDAASIRCHDPTTAATIARNQRDIVMQLRRLFPKDALLKSSYLAFDVNVFRSQTEAALLPAYVCDALRILHVPLTEATAEDLSTPHDHMRFITDQCPVVLGRAMALDVPPEGRRPMLESMYEALIAVLRCGGDAWASESNWLSRCAVGRVQENRSVGVGSYVGVVSLFVYLDTSERETDVVWE